MMSKYFIASVLFLCVVVSFASPCCAGEDAKAALIVKSLAFHRFEGNVERIALLCNRSCVPELFSLEGKNPRVVMEMKGVSLIQTKSGNINTDGTLVKRVRSHLDRQTKILRVVLDMHPSKYYIVSPVQDPSRNGYALTIKDDTDSPLSEEKHIVILHPHLRTVEQEGRLQDAIRTQKKRIAVEATKDMRPLDRGRWQLNAREFEAAVDTFTQNLAAHPQDSLSYRLRGNAYDNLNDRQKALEDWTQAARLGDTLIQSYLDFLQVNVRVASAP